MDTAHNIEIMDCGEGLDLAAFFDFCDDLAYTGQLVADLYAEGVALDADLRSATSEADYEAMADELAKISSELHQLWC